MGSRVREDPLPKDIPEGGLGRCGFPLWLHLKRNPRHTCRHVLRWHLHALSKIEGIRAGMGVSRPVDARDQEPVSLGKRTHTWA